MLALGEAEALTLAEGVGDREGDSLGLGLTWVTSGTCGVEALYLPLNQTRYPASKTIISMITTMVTFRLIFDNPPFRQNDISTLV